jgi:hypothetical protein
MKDPVDIDPSPNFPSHVADGLQSRPSNKMSPPRPFSLIFPWKPPLLGVAAITSGSRKHAGLRSTNLPEQVTLCGLGGTKAGRSLLLRPIQGHGMSGPFLQIPSPLLKTMVFGTQSLTQSSSTCACHQSLLARRFAGTLAKCISSPSRRGGEWIFCQEQDGALGFSTSPNANPHHRFSLPLQRGDTTQTDRTCVHVLGEEDHATGHSQRGPQRRSTCHAQLFLRIQEKHLVPTIIAPSILLSSIQPEHAVFDEASHIAAAWCQKGRGRNNNFTSLPPSSDTSIPSITPGRRGGTSRVTSLLHPPPTPPPPRCLRQS